MAERLLVRIFYSNGATEVRPSDWVIFTTADDFMMDEPEMKSRIEAKVKKDEEVYIANLNKINGIQLYKGEFVNARKNKQHSRGHSHS